MSSYGNKRLISDSNSKAPKRKKTEKPKSESKPLFTIDSPDEVL